jgi:hypothetical protein
MSYTPDIALFSDYLEFATFHRPDALFGIGFLWSEMKKAALWQEKRVLQEDGAGVCYFDFANLDTMLQLPQASNTEVREESLTFDSTRYAPIADPFIDLPDSHHVEKGRAFITWGDDIYFAAFLLSLSLNPTRDLERMAITREEFLRFVSNDVAAFKFLNNAIFPLGDELIEPPRRKVWYSHFSWLEGDSSAVVEKANQTYALENHAILRPIAGDPFVKAVFTAQPSTRETLLTKAGVYVFMVEEIEDGGRVLSREEIAADTLPIYLHWTIKSKVAELLGNID